MKILVISSLYAPDRAPRAYRWTAIAEHMAASGHDVTVIAAWKWGDAPKENRNGVRVFRVGERLIQTARGLLGARPYAGNPTKSSSAGARGAIRTLVSALYSATWAKIFWPDYAALWGATARCAAQKLLCNESFDALITVSHPFTAHMVGLTLKQDHPRLPWVADIGDPFSLPTSIKLNNTFLYERLNRQAEAAVLNAADAVSVTFDGARKSYTETFPSAAGKVTVIPPLLSLPAPAGGGPYFKPDVLPALVYVGTLYRTVRSPDRMLALFRSLKDSGAPHHLHIFGDLNDTADMFEPYKNMIGQSIHLHGTVPRADISRAMADAAALINIGNSTSHQIASKLVEYAAAGRPVINLVGSANDTSLSFLASHPGALSIINGQASPTIETENVQKFLDSPPPIDRKIIDSLLSGFNLETVSGQYLALAATLPVAAYKKVPNFAGPARIVMIGIALAWAWAVLLSYLFHNTDYYLEKFGIFGRFMFRFLA